MSTVRTGIISSHEKNFTHYKDGWRQSNLDIELDTWFQEWIANNHSKYSENRITDPHVLRGGRLANDYAHWAMNKRGQHVTIYGSREDMNSDFRNYRNSKTVKFVYVDKVVEFLDNIDYLIAFWGGIKNDPMLILVDEAMNRKIPVTLISVTFKLSVVTTHHLGDGNGSNDNPLRPS